MPATSLAPRAKPRRARAAASLKRRKSKRTPPKPIVRADANGERRRHGRARVRLHELPTRGAAATTPRVALSSSMRAARRPRAAISFLWADTMASWFRSNPRAFRAFRVVPLFVDHTAAFGVRLGRTGSSMRSRHMFFFAPAPQQTLSDCTSGRRRKPRSRQCFDRSQTLRLRLPFEPSFRGHTLRPRRARMRKRRRVRER